MTPLIGSVVALRSGREGTGSSHSESARAAIIWKIEGTHVLWVPVVNARGDAQRRHRADIRVIDVATRAAAGFPGPRPVIECRRLLRAAVTAFDGRRLLGHIPPALMAEIAATQMREARRLAGETRLAA